MTALERLDRIAHLHRRHAPASSLAEMRAKARRLKQTAAGPARPDRHRLPAADDGHTPSGKKGYENRTQEVSAISRGLKALAKEMHVPVVALSPALPRQRAARRTTRSPCSATCASPAPSSRTPTWSPSSIARSTTTATKSDAEKAKPRSSSPSSETAQPVASSWPSVRTILASRTYRMSNRVDSKAGMGLRRRGKFRFR